MFGGDGRTAVHAGGIENGLSVNAQHLAVEHQRLHADTDVAGGEREKT